MDSKHLDILKLKNWMYRNTRPLDYERYKYHFEQGSQTSVLSALSAYQNEDGGFGNALEADSWNPYSAPIQTVAAIEILEEINVNDNNNAIIQGIIKYLDSGADFENRRWKNAISSTNQYPHAPWWNTDSSSPSREEFNPTATLVGFIMQYADRESEIFRLAVSIAKELIEIFLKDPRLEMHPLKCIDAMIQSIYRANMQNEFSYSELKEAAEAQMDFLIQRDSEQWDSYSCTPLKFIKSPMHPLYLRNKKLIDKEFDYILNSRNEDGTWDLNWRWNSFEREFTISENWWKAEFIIRNMLNFRAFDRL